MIVVSDTTPIISLLKAKKLELLKDLFVEIIIPLGVFEELVANDKFHNEIEQIEHSDFISIISVSDEKSVKILRKVSGLDRGESEAIVLSGEKNADLLLIDERRGRDVAKQMDITITGTLGILLFAYEEGLLRKSEIIDVLNLMENSGIRISDKLHKDIISRIK